VIPKRVANLTPRKVRHLSPTPITIMPSYLVTWTIDIDADTPREAAEKAFRIQQDPDTVALFFTVREGDQPPVNVDLYYEDDAEEPPTTVTCDQCQLLRINGVICHETGCPNERKRFDPASAEWVRIRECPTCGYAGPADELCCTDDACPFFDD
jgi:hypothetical protein